jgi:hypothetical protein
MLVYNEIKLYREHQLDCEFAMVKGNYQARVYSPLDGEKAAEEVYGPTRFLQGRREHWDGSKFVTDAEVKQPIFKADGTIDAEATAAAEAADYSVASSVHDYYEMNDINDPSIPEDSYRTRLFMKLRAVKHPEKMMPKDTTMVPRVFKTMPGDIFTTNMVDEEVLAVRDELTPNAKGILAKVPEGATPDMVWQVVKVYTMPDFQKGVKIMRIK